MTDLNHLIGEIYEAALEPSHWKQVLAELNAMFESIHTGVVYHDRLNRNRTLCWLDTPNPNLIVIQNHYANEYLIPDMDAARVGTTMIQDGVVLSFEISPDMPGFEDKEFWRFTSEDLQTRYRITSKLLRTEHSIAMTSLNRSLDQGAFTPEEIARYQEITPHIARAFRIHHQLSVARAHSEKLLKSLKHLTHGILLLDGNLRLVFANEEGSRIIERQTALGLGRSGRLKAARSDEDQALQRMLDDVLNGRIIVVGRDAPSMALRCDTRESPLKVSAVPLTASGLDPALANEGICLAVFVTDVERGIALPDSYLRATYGLTPAECSVAAGLINRANATDIAQQRGVAESTVRWQIKCLLQKTGTSTQADLVRLLSMLGSEFNLPV